MTISGRVFFTLLFIEMTVLGLVMPVPSTLAGTCSGHYWEAVDTGTYYGSKGSSSIQNAQVTGSSNNFFVNSTSVYKDSNNYAEVGWTWHGGDTSAVGFSSSSKNGVYVHNHGSSLALASVHSFRVNDLPGSYSWVFYVDSTKVPNSDRVLSFTSGIAVAQQERNNACDTPDISHWWSLQRADVGANFSSWTTLGSRNTSDPDYCTDKVHSTEFYVRRTGSSSCDW